jgi:carboxypeptidase PM20D1
MIRRSLLAALSALVAVLAVCAWRASRLVPYQVQAPPADSAVAAAPSAAPDRLLGALRFSTVSTQNPDDFDGQPFLALHDYLRTAFPSVHRSLTREVVGGYSLLYTWKGADSTLDPILLTGHLDVVPVEPGTEGRWTHPPFAGTAADGFIWGRGTLDDKGSVIAILEAVELLLGQGFQPRRTVYLGFGHDEEVGGPRGAAEISRLLQLRTRRLALLLDEGGVVTQGVVPGVERPAAMIGVVEKGMVNVELVVERPGGHSSMPPAHTAVGILSRAITRLEDNPMPARLTPVTERTFGLLAGDMPFARRLLLANLWLFRPLVVGVMARDERAAATLRTTTAATMISGSPKSNVLPGRAQAIVNFRILPGDSPNDVVAHVQRVVNDTAVKVRAMGSGTVPSPIADYNSPEYGQLEKTIAQLFPEAVPVPFLMVGGTDTRHYESLTRNIFRFNPFVVTPDMVSGAHGTDERVRADDFGRGVRFYAQMIRNAQ